MLVGDMGEAMVRGFQEGPVKVAATLKHYMGYSTPWRGKTARQLTSQNVSC